jgi:hypothetical protein
MTSELRPFDLLRSLLEGNVDFVVIGGFALATHGYVRGTEDLDVVPEPTQGNLARLRQVVEELGGTPVDVRGGIRSDEMPVPFGLASLVDGGTWMLDTNYGVLHVMQFVQGAEDYDELRANAVTVPLPDVGDVRFVGREQLLEMKRGSSRLKDQSDVQELEARLRKRDEPA